MEFFFLTRDSREDYPQIGWIPRLPSGADALWNDFGDWQQEEYPEIILKQKDSKWQLFLTAINSGRKDASNRIIQVDLLLTGSTTEGKCALGLIEHYLMEVLNRPPYGEKGEKRKLQKIFSETIANDEPSQLSRGTEMDKKNKAGEICKKLIELPSSIIENGELKRQDEDKSEKATRETSSQSKAHRWCAGCSTGISHFLEYCKDLLMGRREGFAISLANLHDFDIHNLLVKTPVSKSNVVAILLSSPEEKSQPERKLEEDDITSINPKHSRENSPKRRATKQENKPSYLWPIAIIIILVLLIKKCRFL